MTIKKLTTANKQETISIARAALPEILQKEIEKFILNNAILQSNCYPTEKHCCPQCLKAHLIKKAKELNLKEDVFKIIDFYIKEQAGHNGYYLDRDELVSIEEISIPAYCKQGKDAH